MTEEIAPRKQRKEGGGEKIAVHFIPLIKEEQCKIICHFFRNVFHCLSKNLEAIFLTNSQTL